ncbi:glycogen/starch/alpha-glucan phosphorylase [Methylocapsa sp. D3K7]|uniref:glycogen/starch/alpha-glucan phosphorylase n=1 Tax=Methylocapsa sp. D3K7 TaxID=3041435 RepID=UPI00244E6025|nr:glycogen/starch/alpha-glucan phosphorylase [Methylocapsa sp. D3K7]WGJ16044.1 glycogen/starch/alpha-glucan phosphorylase [Methylocapsa sp. D3K7]
MELEIETAASKQDAPAGEGGVKTEPDVAAIRDAIIEKLTYALGKRVVTARPRDWFIATALTVRDRIVERWIASNDETHRTHRKRVYYLSLEFLIGRLLIDALTNMEMIEQTRAALAELGVDLEELRELEPDAALGNGGLGRLAACFMESMATLSIAAYGYGIRYDHGLFRQRIKDGRQLEYPEDWLSFGNPWEFPRPEFEYEIGFGGRIEAEHQEDGSVRHIWHPAETVKAVAYDTPIPGWRGAHVNALRLWSARAPDPLQLDVFNSGDHVGALMDRVRAESISKVLYPSDASPAGEELRLRQEYFFASASLQDLVRRHLSQHGAIESLADKVAIQLNDTHPAIAVTELMRILVDLHQVPWREAWAATQATFSYTNHTLLPEALETWPVPLMERLLPRHMQIIYLINAIHLANVSKLPDVTGETLSALSLIDEAHGRRVRMGHLAFLGSHKVNGVSKLHSDLMKVTVFRELDSVLPGRITNKTNGITFRRWLKEANPGLTSLLTEVTGDRLLDDAMMLEKVAAVAGDSSFQERYAAHRRANKVALSKLVRQRVGVVIDPDALFDVHIKRIHEYKRQVLNILEAVAVYDAIRAQPMRDWIPRVKIFAGKAAASYATAKLIIRLANDVAEIVNSDPTVRGLLKIVFLPNYNVSLAERIIPAADLSEQISTAGMEASGTGNMKFALNGALTIGTLDGANVEIREKVGAENIFIFGLTAEEVEAHRQQGIDGRPAINRSVKLAEVLDAIGSGVFSPDEPDRYRGLVNMLTHNDYFLVTADFDSYFEAQRSVFRRWRDKHAWWQAAALNTARMGWFSSDRTISEYAQEIWNVPVRPPGRG